jgi:hypothetical protein
MQNRKKAGNVHNPFARRGALPLEPTCPLNPPRMERRLERAWKWLLCPARQGR